MRCLRKVFVVCAVYSFLALWQMPAWAASTEKMEMWEGKALTARFRVGMCYDRSGRARGVLLLRHARGQEDVYHLYGTLKNDEFALSHNSGHTFSGKLTGPTTIEGRAKLKNGLKMTLKGTRKFGVPLAPADCAPPSQK